MPRRTRIALRPPCWRRSGSPRLIDPPVSPDYARRRLPVRGMAWKIGVGRVYDAAAAIGRPAPTRPCPRANRSEAAAVASLLRRRMPGDSLPRAASARDPACGSRCAAWKIGSAARVLSVAPSPDVIRATAKHRGDSELMRVSVARAAAPAIGAPPARFTRCSSRRAQVARGQGRPSMRRGRAVTAPLVRNDCQARDQQAFAGRTGAKRQPWRRCHDGGCRATPTAPRPRTTLPAAHGARRGKSGLRRGCSRWRRRLM
jgi:hypothetical protein